MSPTDRDQVLILVDREGRPQGYAPRAVCHEGDGVRHAAVAVVLWNTGGDILLQRRRSALWDGWWDITGATHPLHGERHDETFDDAARRCLRAEWHVELPIARVLDFVYFERYEQSAENEYCVLYAGTHDGAIGFDREYAYDMRWLAFDAALAEGRGLATSFTPWARITLELLSGSKSLRRPAKPAGA
jgi:isopentenyldiphosphate isomerase